jgi:ketosteroid isomerase-like protein
MSAQDNLATVQGLYEAFGEGDVQAILDHLTDDVDWATDSATGAAPWHGIKHGKDEVATFFAGIAEAIDVSAFDVVAMAATDDAVLTFVRFGFSAKGGGEQHTMHIHHYWRFRDGRVAYYRGGEDTALVAQVLGARV